MGNTAFDPSTIDNYNFDVDPDQNFFSSSEASNQFNDLCVSMPATIFSTFHLNIRSLSSNYDTFFHYLSSLKHDFSVIALSESTKEMFKLPKYNSVHYVRENRT